MPAGQITPAAYGARYAVDAEDSFARHLNKFAYRNGTSTDLLRRVGAIYLRDIAVAPH
jgi:hypothetical protein